MLPIDGFDYIRALSLFFAVVTFIFVAFGWKRYSDYHAQFALILLYLGMAIIYYAVYLLTRLIVIPWMTPTLANQWGAVLRFWDISTWFTVALLYFLIGKGKRV
jgi:hypothetical protein